MFKKIKNLFSGHKAEPERQVMTPVQIRIWLESRAEKCKKERSDAMNASRKDILMHRDAMMTLIHEFGAESESDQPLHHKVEQVNRHALPQFCKKMETELSIEFSTDDETFYREVAMLIDGCYKAYRGPGRYLHHIYPDEIKVFRDTISNVGQELNRLTDIVKSSRECLHVVEEIQDLLDEYDNFQHQEEISAEMAEKYAHLIREKEEAVSLCLAEKESFLSSSVYHAYLERIEELNREKEDLSTRKEAVDALFRTALPVWRKAERSFHESGNDTGTKKMNEIIHLASYHRYEDPSLPVLIEETSKPLFEEIKAGKIPIKNTFEKALFPGVDEYLSRLRSSLSSYAEVAHLLYESEKAMVEDPAGRKEHDLSKVLDENQRELERLKGELSREEEKHVQINDSVRKTAELLSEKVRSFPNQQIEIILPEITEGSS